MAKDLTAALAELTEQAAGKTSRSDKVLYPAAKPDAVQGRIGKPSSKSSTGSGISGPLTETDYADRTWFAEETILSTDGLIAMRVRRVKSISFVDGSGNPLQQVYKA